MTRPGSRAAPGSVPTTVAVFDFDGTLTRRDSVVPFLRRVGGTVPTGVRLASCAHEIAPALVRRDRDRLREVATRQVFAHRTLDDVVGHATAFGEELVREGLRDDTVARLGWHRDQGHRVVVVSASYEEYLRVVGEALAVDAVLGTRLERDGERCTGRLDGANCRGPEKVRRLREWLAAEQLDRAAIVVWAYGDSPGDRELLAEADHPVWVDGPVTAAPTIPPGAEQRR